MKRLAQFAALLLIALIASQPAAAIPCSAGAPVTCLPGCPMSMSGMDASCPMTAAVAEDACADGCCAQAVPQAILQVPSRQATTRAAITALASGELLLEPSSIAFQGPRSIDPFVSPPLYLLHRVFRI